MTDFRTTMVLDTSISSDNLGDFIIMEAVRKQLKAVFPDHLFSYSATHDVIGKTGYKNAENADHIFLGGSNILAPRFTGRQHGQWKIGFRDALHLRDVIGVGVGWQSYKKYDGLLNHSLIETQKRLYDKVLSKSFFHSVRDEYTKKQVESLGLRAINTSCVTMWDLTPEHIDAIPTVKANEVVTTITDYCNNTAYLRMYESLLSQLLATYNTVSLWVQSVQDVKILEKLNVKGKEKIRLIFPSLDAFDNKLSEDVDYVGTRLHAGIRAIQKGKRSLIIEVDNRAHELARDTGLPTLPMERINELSSIVERRMYTNIKVPYKQIRRWKNQFSE